METKKPRVMIADDERHCRVLMKAVMNSMRCEVVGEAGNGPETLELYRKLKPHLLLLDINMPMTAGDEVLKQIVQEFPNAFVIMLSSVVDMESVEKCLSLGAANYIRKDTPLEEIKQIIKDTWQVFARSRARVANN
ncbi:response regulator transcription factor [Desulforhabdus amnigena]|jgi:two-component system chemotaxis response regulator CheY|nr:response regulator transcription factor [Desulforhabdus amnigena]NLJ27517.1 response regulator [Deltaproteobacteria bacterium]